MSTGLCGVQSSSGETGYRVELRLNGSPVPGRTLERKLPISTKDIASHAASVRLFVQEGDQISLHVIPTGGRRFKVKGDRASMTVTRVKQFG